MNTRMYLAEKLLLPHITLANRLVMPPMATSKATANGKVTDQILNYYNEKTYGGYIGLVICEHSYVTETGRANPGQVSIAKDEDVEGLKKLVEVIHNNGSKVIAQISHAGSIAKPPVKEMKTAGPSLLTETEKFIPEKEMTVEDIHRTVDEFAAAARRAQNAGFDGVEIHSAHGYLLNQFYSPLTNLRQDAYGGMLDGRIQIHLEIVNAVRSVADPEFSILLRLGACDYMEGGNTIDDAVYACRRFQDAGVDMLDISGGLAGFAVKEKANLQGYFQDETAIIKENVRIPVILTGGITDANEAEQLLRNKKADLIGIGRALLKDSDWPKRAMAGL